MGPGGVHEVHPGLTLKLENAMATYAFIHTVTYQFWCLSVPYIFFCAKNAEDLKPSGFSCQGYESLEQLLTPWPSSNGLSPPSATPAVSRTRRSRARATSNRATSNDTGTAPTPATPLPERERSVREAGGPSPESPAATPVGQSLWSKDGPRDSNRGGNLKDESLGCMEIMPPHLAT